MANPVERLAAALSDRYVIERKLGEGGMATVYLAKDLKHNRQVALKVLKPELAAVVGAERFLSEIETTANLQHPHILPLYDSGEADSFLFYVMPFVQGATLWDRLDQERQLPVDEAVQIASSVANALDYAHRQGVVHRDIKPANILFQDGEPVVGDFGIALALGAGGRGRMTETGLSVGTPYYMSPEQATGDQVIGPATDIYAIACVLYQMLTGEPPYSGMTAQAILGRIIQGVPVSATAVRKSVPANVDAAVRKGLEKLPADRFAGAQDFVRALGDPAFRHGAEEREGWAPTSTRWRTATIAASAVAVVAIAAGLTGAFGSRTAPAPVERHKLEMPSLGAEVPWGRFLALAPDGSGMVYLDIADGSTTPQLFYKARGDVDGTPLPGTEGAHDIDFSPDGLWVAFVQDGNVVKRPVQGGAAITLAEDADNNYAALDWMADGNILYEIEDGDVLARIADDGSLPPDTLADVGSLRWAQGLVGQEAALVLNPQEGRLGVADFESGEITYHLENIARAWLVPTGHVVYVRVDGAVFATPFDPETRELGAIGTPLFTGVRTGRGWADMVVGEDGTMVYVSGPTGDMTGDDEYLVWVERDGTFTAVDPNWPASNLNTPVLSPDGSKVALAIADDVPEIWVKELPAGPLTRLTSGESLSFDPVWTPDGRSLLFVSRTEDAEAKLRRIRADGSMSEPEDVFSPDHPVTSPALTPSGSGFAFSQGGGDVGYHDLEADSTVMLLTSDFNESAATFSPDGRWLAYTSNVTGQREIFVRPFPDVGRNRTQVSNGGGSEPLWAHNGSELFYRSSTDTLVSAVYTADSTFTVESRTDLFEMGNDYISRPGRRGYDVDATDQRFLMVRNVEAVGPEEAIQGTMILVLNWFDELRAQLDGGN